MKIDLFLSMANIIAYKYNVVAVVNYEMQTVNFVGNCGREIEEKCARELAEIFENGVVITG